MADEIRIADRRIGVGLPTYVVAEISANHHGSFEEAVKLVHAAKEVGADAVKLQTYTADSLTLDSDREEFRIASGTIWDGRTLYDLYSEAQTPWEWQPKLKKIADALGLHLFSSPFDFNAVEFLTRMDVPAFKISSFEIVDLPLIRTVAATRKPMIVSTGLATLDEIREALEAAQGAGAKEIAILKCTSAYPALPEEMNLQAIPFLRDTLHIPVGLSDHTLGLAAPVAAVALGACIIEKHLTLSRKIPGPDSAFSLEPEEFRLMVDNVRSVEKALGGVHLGPTQREQASLRFRRSLFVVQDIKMGERFTRENVKSIRPAAGLHPRHLDKIVGKHATRDIPRGTPFSWDLLSTGR